MQARERQAGERLTIGQVVDELSTEFPDITHSSLRFLEREGLITPERTEGGHRLFPPDQVQRVRRIKQWQRERLSLDEIRDRLDQADKLEDTDAIASELLEYLIDGDREGAQQLVIRADEIGLPLATIFDAILAPVMRETGERWERGEFTVGQEKEISALARDLIAQLSARHQPAVALQEPAILAACVDGEYHELGLRMVTALLRERGFPVHYLGPSVATDFLIERALARHARAALLSATKVARRPALMEAIEALGSIDVEGAQPLIIVGGAGAPEQSEFPEDQAIVIIEHADLQTSMNVILSTLESMMASSSG